MNTLNLDKVVEGSRAAWDRARRHGAKGVKLAGQGLADAMREAANARYEAMSPILRQLSSLPPQLVAAELERRGFGKISYKTVSRARQRLGFVPPNTRGERIKAGLAAAKAREVKLGRPRKAANEETAAT
jgi:hypothetical protein